MHGRTLPYLGKFPIVITCLLGPRLKTVVQQYSNDPRSGPLTKVDKKNCTPTAHDQPWRLSFYSSVVQRLLYGCSYTSPVQSSAMTLGKAILRALGQCCLVGPLCVWLLSNKDASSAAGPGVSILMKCLRVSYCVMLATQCTCECGSSQSFSPVGGRNQAAHAATDPAGKRGVDVDVVVVSQWWVTKASKCAA